jgi:molecular chaperone GrpE (heat shock protein)
MAGKTRGRRRPQIAGLANTLAEASWTQADRALAQAIADFSELDIAQTPGKRKALMALIAQSLQRAARRRGLERIGVEGEVAPFDAERHEFAGRGPRAPKEVRILVPGVARGAVVLVKARVAASRSRARA